MVNIGITCSEMGNLTKTVVTASDLLAQKGGDRYVVSYWEPCLSPLH